MPRTWGDLLGQLRDRGQGVRESGAFLLATGTADRRVERLVLYDELDSTCLVGGIDFHREGYQRLWDVCEREHLLVIGDVHTHPSSHTGQSGIDRGHPMLSRAGHVALIVPNYAEGEVASQEVGVHHYQGTDGWRSYHGRLAARYLYIGRWA
ncbi:MAG: hypothetical protein M0010_19750 [Actinomycetota bacterium]|nr:hypothetical protein [Actinomycetota bacterium]